MDKHLRGSTKRARDIDRERVMMLRGTSNAKFVELLLHPPAPTEKLRVAFEQHRRDVANSSPSSRR
jgi:uncharacterized protein (DUF1778 family)